MNVLILYAHPEPRSLNGALKDFMLQHLTQQGHQVKISDLYAMNWKATLDADDFPQRNTAKPFNPSLDSQQALLENSQSHDITQEQEKLRWADTVLIQFPLWWYSMPAIMKGWFERVYAYGFAYGVGEHNDHHWGDRFGEGRLVGKRAMLIVTMGGWDSHYSPRGINGPLNDLLFPIHHGLLFYPGMTVMPAFPVYHTSKMTPDRFATTCQSLGQRLDHLWQDEPIPFRPQNQGDYDIPALTLKENITPHLHGFAAHLR